jgi:hypothetical protein
MLAPNTGRLGRMAQKVDRHPEGRQRDCVDGRRDLAVSTITQLPDYSITQF